MEFQLPVQGKGVVKPTEQTPVEIVIEGTTHKVTTEGTIVNDKGEVIKTKEEVTLLLQQKQNPQKTAEEIEAEKKLKEKETQIAATLTEGLEVELDGKSFKLNKDGDAVDDKGTVVKTKAELVKLQLDAEENQEVDYISEITKSTNIVLQKDGKPIEYENTLSGISSYVKDVHSNGVELGEKRALESYFSKFPVLKQVLNHLVLNNGSIDNFANQIDYTKIKLSESDESQWENIYIAAQTSRGIPLQEAKDYFKYLKDDKKAKEAAEKSLVFLSETQKARDNEAQLRLEKQMQLEKEEEISYTNEVNNIIASKTLKVNNDTFNLPDVIRIKDAQGRTETKTLSDFVAYFSSPVPINTEQGVVYVTRYQYDRYLKDTKRTTDDDIFDAFRLFTNYDDTQLIAAKAKTEQVKKLVIKTTAAGHQKGTPPNQGGSIKLNLPVQ